MSLDPAEDLLAQIDTMGAPAESIPEIPVNLLPPAEIKTEILKPRPPKRLHVETFEAVPVASKRFWGTEGRSKRRRALIESKEGHGCLEDPHEAVKAEADSGAEEAVVEAVAGAVREAAAAAAVGVETVKVPAGPLDYSRGRSRSRRRSRQEHIRMKLREKPACSTHLEAPVTPEVLDDDEVQQPDEETA